MDHLLAYLYGVLTWVAVRAALQVPPLYVTWRRLCRTLRREKALSRPRVSRGSSDLLLWPRRWTVRKKLAPRT